MGFDFSEQAKKIIDWAPINNEVIPVIEIDRIMICSRILQILKDIDERILEEMNWDTRIDYVIQNLNLDDDTDMDIDSDLAAIFLVPIADPISPPNLGNVVLYIEKQLKKGIRPFSKRQGLKNSCPTLFIAFELRQWLKENHTESPRLSLNSPSSLIRGALKTQLMVYIVSRYGVQGHRIFFDLQARIFFSRSWPRTARTIADIAGWISLTLEKRNETIRRVLR